MSRIPIGIDLDGEGAHPAAWRAAGHAPTDLFTPGLITARIAAVDNSGLGFAIFPEYQPAADAGVRAGLDTIETATFAAASSDRIGLVPVVNAIHAEPFHLGNQLNTLDWASRGRGGWLVGAADSPDIAAGYGRDHHSVEAAVVEEARDVVAAVRRLWDTWEDDVLIADQDSGRFIDLDRWHYADAVGASFSIKGPGLLPRPPQGQLVVWALEPGAVLAPLIDVAVVSGRSVSEVIARAAAAGEAGVPRRVASVEIALDRSAESATDRLRILDRATGWSAGDRLRIVGSPAEAAERLASLAPHVDGILLHPAVIDVDLPIIADELLPRLDAAGVLRAPLPGESLRELFGLPRPANVFELERENR
ncbi:LLM class flavin-dependent oxidoreductase [Microbacterium trichothecenolyticum]|uniref:LLM class flavin-dependent oxidoreductase n=1 Tax=Microbacterium trichothecenolyticum TaxID=69370 RepID=UPI001C6E5DFB|nr:LLM class flavin-dependent oxidoreductase [Microbacterium trichothecenolyticum]MBW9121925.1 LLM class flavin-dependent oxidoreductase [Microbacterium trichothecenolyticum]